MDSRVGLFVQGRSSTHPSFGTSLVGPWRLCFQSGPPREGASPKEDLALTAITHLDRGSCGVDICRSKRSHSVLGVVDLQRFIIRKWYVT